MGSPSSSSSTKIPQGPMTGSQPGALDPTQALRLLNDPHSLWTFASFDPYIGAPSARFRNPAYKEKDVAAPKRIIVEQRPDGNLYWRFVPKAHLEPGAADEGKFPRQVELCGHVVEMHEDQWDVYKLDPHYTCVVRAPPFIPVITRNVLDQPPKTSNYTPPSPPSDTAAPKLKRRLNPSPKARERTIDDFLEENVQKKFKARTRHPYFDDEDEVEHMVVDETGTRNYKQSLRLKKVKANMQEARNRRREWNSQRKAQLMKQYEDIVMQSPSKGFEPGQSTPYPARQDDSDPEDFTPEDLEFLGHQFDPNAPKSTMRGESMAQPAPEPAATNVTEASPDIEILDEETVRQRAIEESKRKIAELEADRPIWEHAARVRQAREEEEEQLAAASKYEKERAAQAELLATREREALAAKQRAEDEAKRKQHELRTKRESARLQAKNEQRRWFMGHWNASAALDRFRSLSEKFDQANFHKGDVVIFETIPWPLLLRPGTYGPEDIEWRGVEEFFEEAKRRMRINEFATLVEKCHKRFHPDRWRSRRVLQAVTDDEEKECLEIAGNTVSQAMTPLWQELKENGHL